MKSDPVKGIERVLIGSEVAQQVLATVRTPGWKHIGLYLRARRRLETEKLIYTYRLPQHQTEMIVCQAIIKLIDDILGDTDETALKLASSVSDLLTDPVGSRSGHPYRKE